MESTSRYVRRQEQIRRDVKNAAVLPHLPYSSIDGGRLTFLDNEGNEQIIVGQQWDGSNTAAPVGGAPPVTPTVPLVVPVPGGLALYWDGTYVDDSPTRMDFKRVTFHAVTDVNDLDILSPTQICGEITIATGGEVFATLPPVEHFIVAVAWSESGKFSFESDIAFGTPLVIVDPALWQQHEDALTEANGRLDVLRADLDAVEGGDGSVSGIIALLQNATSTRHAIY